MKQVIIIKDDKVGQGELGETMMNGILQTILACSQNQKELLPKSVVLLNRGVLLATKNSLIQNQKIVQTLKALQDLGVEILSCQTCLSYFSLEDNVLVGRVATAMEIVPLLLSQESLSL